MYEHGEYTARSLDDIEEGAGGGGGGGGGGGNAHSDVAGDVSTTPRLLVGLQYTVPDDDKVEVDELARQVYQR